MNPLLSLQPILNEVTHRFAGRLGTVQVPRPNEVYFDVQMELVPGFCGHLYKKWKTRLVSLFADDARDVEGSFHLYYVFAVDSAGGFFILRVKVPPETPEFTSLTNAIHAVNWQEREVQDLFGLKVTDLKLNFDGKFYKISVKTPFLQPKKQAAAPVAAAPAGGAKT